MGFIILFLTLFLRLIMGGEDYDRFYFEDYCSDFEVFLIKKQ